MSADLREYSSLRAARARSFYVWLATFRGGDDWLAIRDDARAELGWTATEIERAVDDGAARGWVFIDAGSGGVHVSPWLADDDSPLAYDDEVAT